MGKETSKEFFESVLGLGHEWEVSEVTLNETSDQVTLDLSLRSEGCLPGVRGVLRDLRP
jgi:hypothetical protein